MNMRQEIELARARRKEQSRNERAAQNATDYRDGYAAAFADYMAFRGPLDQLDELAALNEKHVAGYRAGYADASRGKPSRWPQHSVPMQFPRAA